MTTQPTHEIHPRPVFYAAGNRGATPEEESDIKFHGYYSITANLKNATIVGSVHSNNAIHARSSSYGPTLDGRIKPDLVAAGDSDWFPSQGLSIEVAEIKLHAKDPNHQLDYIWHFPPADEHDIWKGSGSFKDTSAIVGDVLQAYIQIPSKSRLYWHDQPEADEEHPFVVPSIEADLYDAVSITLRLGELPDMLNVEQSTDRFPLPLTHRYPSQLRFQWGGIESTSYEHARYIDYPTITASQWMTLHYDMDEDWQGSIARMRITPMYYRNGIYAPSNQGGYAYSSGTSMASPAVAGVSALALQKLDQMDEYDLDHKPPAPALIRGIMMHTARDLLLDKAPKHHKKQVELDEYNRYGPGPDWSTGYGLVDAWAVQRLIDLHQQSPHWYEQEIQAGEVQQYSLQLKSAGTLKVSLVWDDPAGSLLTEIWESKLVHDLDIVVQDPQGKVYSPWVLTPPPLDQNQYLSGIDLLDEMDIQPARRCVSDHIDEVWGTSARSMDQMKNEDVNSLDMRSINEYIDQGMNHMDQMMNSDIDMNVSRDMDISDDLSGDFGSDFGSDFGGDFGIENDMDVPAIPPQWIPRKNQECVDELNNYERVEITEITEGNYTIFVRAHHQGTQAQKYYLIISQECPWQQETDQN